MTTATPRQGVRTMDAAAKAPAAPSVGPALGEPSAAALTDAGKSGGRAVGGILDRVGRSVVESALARIALGSVAIHDRGRLVESSAVAAPGPRTNIYVHDDRFYSALAFRGGTGLAEAYMDEAWTTDNLPGLIETTIINYKAYERLESFVSLLTVPMEWVKYRLARNSLTGSRRNIEAHYDLSNEFFALWLDPTMMYSCGIFENGATTLEAAQVEKVDRACRKLNLKQGEHLLEIGTGWGYAACHAAKHYGVRVTTTTISQRQFEAARVRVKAMGLEGRVEVVMEDYRLLRGQFDKLLSIEMVEAVGAENLPGYFEACSRLLKPHGAMLMQAIVIRDQYFAAAARRMDFLKEYIFPGSCLLGVENTLTHLRRKTDLRLWHMEDIGPHYATTLAMWRAAFLSQVAAVRGMGFDERFVRMWDYYLAYCEGAFRGRHVGDVQMLLTKPMCRMDPAGPVSMAQGSGA